MEQIGFVANFITLLGVIVVLVWQVTSSAEYAKHLHHECEDELDIARKEIERLRIELERVNLLLIGQARAAISIRDSQVDVGRDMTGGDHVVGG